MIINEEVMTNYLEQIVLLLNEILDVVFHLKRKCNSLKSTLKQITYNSLKVR
jgi:predicted metal-dependent phosphoesterase TrpH